MIKGREGDKSLPAADTYQWWSVPGPNIFGEFLDNGEPPESEDFV